MLIMQNDVDRLAAQIRPKAQAMLRAKSLYDAAALIFQYKIQIWSRIEYHSGALLHYGDTQISKLDRIQKKNVEEQRFSRNKAPQE